MLICSKNSINKAYSYMPVLSFLHSTPSLNQENVASLCFFLCFLLVISVKIYIFASIL